MADITLKLDARTHTGHHADKTRREGLIPSVVYGGKTKPINTQSPKVATSKVVYRAGRHTPVRLTIDGKRKLAIIKRIDVDPVKHTIRHIAFHAIKQNEKIVTEVPIVLVHQGESEAEKAGLVILQALERVEVRALPADLPDSFEISVANLVTTDDKLTLADSTLPDGVEFADAEQDLGIVVANVYEPSALQAANEAAAGSAEEEMPKEVEEEAESEGASQKDTEQETTADKSEK